jgi:hypothetical protein
MTENESKLLTKVSEKIDALFKKYDDHKLDLHDLKRDVKTVCESVDKHGACLYGNGKPGLLTDMAKIKSVLNWVLGIAGSVMAAIIIAYIVKRG